MKKGKNNSLRIVALILAMIMAVGVFPMQAFADDAEAGSAVVVPSETKEQQTETNNSNPADNSGEAAEPGQEADPADTADNEAEPAEDNTGSEQPAAADYTFPQATVYLKDIFEALGISFKNNSLLSADTDLIVFSETELKNKNYESITLTATGSFELAKLSIEDNKSTRTITLSYTSPDDPQLVDNGALYANDDLYITGKIPGNGAIEVLPVTVAIDGQEVLAAYDINIYANSRQQSKGSTWQPADEKVTVHFKDDAFANAKKVNVYHVADESADPEYVTTVKPVDSWITFEAESFSVYVFTKVIEKTVEINGSTYKISVSYDADAKIPDGAELEVTEVPADNYLADVQAALGMQEGDSFLYNKFLDISIVKDGSKIEPASEVTVSVELLDVEGPAEALSVVHFGASGPERITETTVENGVLSFETDSFSIFNFGIITGTLLDMLTEYMSVAVVGIKSLYAQYAETALSAVEEGLEVLEAYNVSASGLLASLTSLVVKVRLKTALTLGALEDVIVYGIKDGRLSSVLYTGLGTSEQQLNIDGFDGFALVRDTGLRRRELSLGNILLGGLVPKNATATAEDVLETYRHIIFGTPKTGETVSAVAAYDISILNGTDEYQPSAGNPVNVTITDDAIAASIAAGKTLSLWHIKDDGTREEITGFTINGNTLSFAAEGFSVYVVVDHEGGSVVTPRVEFHFIAGTTSTPDTTTEPGIALYTSGPYIFRNKSDDNDAGKTQASMIVKDGDTLESIEAPGEIGDANFFGWYTVNLKTDSTTYNSASHTFSGQIVYSWPDDTMRVELDNTISITNVTQNGNGAITSLTWTVNGVSQEVSTNIDADGCAHVYLAPIYTNYNFVNFHLAPYSDPSSAYIMTRKLIVLGNSATTDIRIGDIKSGFADPSYYRFVGWEYYDTDRADWVQIISINDDDAEPSNAPPKVGTYLTAEGKDYDLYPIFVAIRWVTFNRGAAHNGSDYLAPMFIRTSDSGAGTYTVSSFYGDTAAKRVGYDFKGWYLNACFGNGNVFLNENNGDEGYDYTVDVNGTPVTTHYGKIIQLTDETGSFVSGVRGKDFYTTDNNNNNIRMVNSGATLPAGAVKLFSIDASGNLSVYTTIRDRLPVYAKWESKASAAYKVVIWMQTSSDSVDAVNYDQWLNTYKTNNPNASESQIAAAWTATGYTKKTYDFYTYDQRNAAGNAVVSPNATDRGYVSSNPNGEFTGFQLGYYDQNVTVDPQGTTVLNVYYDRREVTLTFQIRSNSYQYHALTETDNDNDPEKYGDVNGDKARIYWRNGAFRTSNNNNGTIYTGTIYTRDNWQDYRIMTGLYK